MNTQLTVNWKRAQELAIERDRINANLVALQEELRHLSSTVNHKIAEKEAIVAELLRLQDSTAKLVASGEWVLKDIPDNTLTGVPTGTQTAIISKTLDSNPVWNFVKRTFLSVWNFFSEKLKAKPQSVTQESLPDSSTKAS